MTIERNSDGEATARAERAARHAALGDVTRLGIVDALRLADRSPTELGRLAGVGTNLLAFHLDVLEDAGLIRRCVSEGDARRRYVCLDRQALAALDGTPALGHPTDRVLFVCTENAARSQLAAHLWHRRTGREALCAGTCPAERVHPLAVEVAARHGLDLSDATPRARHEITGTTDLVVSVCDRAHEADPDDTLHSLHWSVPDPSGGNEADFEGVYADIDDRVHQLAVAAG